MEGLISGDIKKIIASLPSYCELSGSRAIGKENPDSDYDFYVPEEKWEKFKKWAKSHISANYTSVVTGQIAYYVNSVEHMNLIEFSYLFPRKEEMLKEMQKEEAKEDLQDKVSSNVIINLDDLKKECEKNGLDAFDDVLSPMEWNSCDRCGNLGCSDGDFLWVEGMDVDNEDDWALWTVIGKEERGTKSYYSALCWDCVKKLKKKIKTCPRCKKKYDEYPALSRKDNKTKICPECGLEEALEIFQVHLKTKEKGEK